MDNTNNNKSIDDGGRQQTDCDFPAVGEETTTGTCNNDNDNTFLTRRQKWNVLWLVLSFSCVVACLTLIVGTGTVVIDSVGGSTTVAPFTLACFFVGMAAVSLIFTHWMFDEFGRKSGFWIGCVITIVGSGIAIGGLYLRSSPVVLIAYIVLGMGIGVAMYLRFAAAEVVPKTFAAKAVTWTLCGGCIAAFVGPEIAASTKGAFSQDNDTDGGDDNNLTYLGVFLVAAAFSVAEAIFVGFVRFEKQPTDVQPKAHDSGHRDFANVCTHELKDNNGDVENQISTEDRGRNELGHKAASPGDDGTKHVAMSVDVPIPAGTPQLGVVLRQSSFVLPVLISILSWAIMAMPMSIFRVNMRDVGFTERQSLTVIELHFLAMYMPGFWSGPFISRFGPIKACYVAIGCNLIATAINLSTPNTTSTTATWFLSLIFLGIGWNFGFSAATIWVQRVYAEQSHQVLKSKIQAANEFFTFIGSGGLIFSTSFINQAVGGGLDGWKLLNIVIAIFILVFVFTVCIAMRLEPNDDDDSEQKELGQTTRLED